MTYKTKLSILMAMSIILALVSGTLGYRLAETTGNTDGIASALIAVWVALLLFMAWVGDSKAIPDTENKDD